MTATARPISEAHFMRQVIQLATLQGWATYHTYDSRRSAPGFPDLLLVRDRILYRELKTDTGSATPEQLAWICRLIDAGGDASIWRPSMLETTIKDTLCARIPA